MPGWAVSVTASPDNCSLEIKKALVPWKKSYDKFRQHIKKQRHDFADKGSSRQSYGFPVVLYGCENWTMKKAECRRTDSFELCGVGEDSLEDSKEIKPVNPKGNKP